MHGPVKPSALRRSAAAESAGKPPVPTAGAEGERPVPADDAQLRDALHLVLNVNVYDCAGRAVTVKDMLRGSLATQVRVALDRKRPG
jgi:hypothetical protein